MFIRFKFIVLVIFGLGLKNSSSQNLALNKRYTMSDDPNYGYLEQNLSKTALTDGQYTIGLFWDEKTTLGWEGIKMVGITIDLLKEEKISSVSFNSARGKKAGVYFPSSVMVFFSNDNKSFRYVGDATSNVDNLPGDYAVRKFLIESINQSSRYVMLKIFATQNNIFCDEIEVFKSRIMISRPLVEIPKVNLTDFINKQLDIESRRKAFLGDLRTKSVCGIEKRTVQQNKIKQPIVNRRTLDQFEKEMKNIRSKELNKKFGSSIIVEESNPWKSPPEYPMREKKSNFLKYTSTVPLFGTAYYGFTLTNTTLLSQRLEMKFQSENKGLLFEAKRVYTIDQTKIPDALFPIVEHLDLQAGETKLLVLKLDGTQAGVDQAKIMFTYANKHTIDVEIYVDIINKSMPETSLNTINWGYLNQHIIKNNIKAAAKDLEGHNINVISVPEQYVPTLNSTDFSILEIYLRPFTKAKKILIEMNYNQEKYKITNSSVTFMSDTWKNQFKIWYTRLVETLYRQGFSEEKIYLFPYDEVKGDNIRDLKAFILWIHSEFKNAKVYSTLDNEDAITQLTPILDVSQILWSKIDLDKNYKNLYNEIWSYDTQGFSRSLNAYTYYRLMAWRAYLFDLSGIGFWNYADVGQNTENRYNGLYPQRDYAIIYTDSAGNIVSSRRWEAFKLGVQEYEIIKEYGKLFGIDIAKKKVREVIANEDNFEISDRIIQEMLKELKK
jgi:hypothetical protein